MPIEQPAEFERAEVHVPDSVVDLFQAHVVKDFFDPQLPGNAIQLIILKTDLAWTDAEYEKRKSSNGRTAIENNEIFHQLIKKLDWTALLGLLQ